MKKFIILFLIILGSILNGQDSGMFNAGNFGGPVTWGIPSGSDIYFSQGSNLNKGKEGSENIEIVSNSYLRDGATQIKINGDNLYAIYGPNSEFKNEITSTTLSNLGSSSSNNFAGIDNGINKFDEVDGFGLLAHNKDGVLSDKLVGEDLLGNTNDSFEYVTDFKDFTINGYIAYLITDDGTTDNIIEIIDFSAKSTANKVGSILVKQAQSVYYSNGYLYVACESGEGLKIIDVSNPTSPALVGEYKPDAFSQVIVDGTTAYLRKDNVLTILNVSDPTNPVYVSTKTFENLSTTLKFTAVQSEKIYYVDNGIFGIIETSTLSLGQIFLSALSSDWVAADETTLVVYDKANYYFHSLEDPDNPKAFAVLAAEVEPVDFTINGSDFYVTTNSKFYIHDLENLVAPSTEYTYFGEFSAFKVATDFAVIGEYKYSGSTKFYYFEIIDLSDKNNPTQLHLAEYPTIGTITSIEINPDNNTLYLVSELEGKIWLAIFDITNKSAPTRVYLEKLETITSDTIDGKDTKLGINGTELYVVTNYMTLNNYYAAKIFAYSVQESSNPRLIAGLQITESEYNNVVFFEDKLLVAVPNDKEIHMYSLDGDETFRKEWTQVETLPLENEHANMTSFLNKPTQSTLAPERNKFNKINGYEWDYTTVVISEKKKGSKLIKVYVPKKTKVQLTTSVLPTEATSGGCSVSPSGGEYDKNASVSISASAATGWVFDNWSGDLTGSASPSNLTMSSDKNVVGNFKPTLTLNFTSYDTENIEVPSAEDIVAIGKTKLTAGGVDWYLFDIKYTALHKFNPQYSKVYLKFNGIESEGFYEKDGDGLVTGMEFVVNQRISEGTTITLELYYKFEFPKNEKDLLTPLDEIKKLGVSVKMSQVNCEPVPSIEGIKTPQTLFESKLKTIGWIWNTSLSPHEPFITIQDAINDPRTLDGHEIEVWEGYYKYSSKVEISKKLQIDGIGDRKNIIFEVPEKTVFDILTNNTSIHNLTFENSYTGITSRSTSNITIADCTFKKIPSLCIYLNNAKTTKIESNLFEDAFTTAIKLNDADGFQIDENTFKTIDNSQILITINNSKGICNINSNSDANRKGNIICKDVINEISITENELGNIEIDESENIIVKDNIVSSISIEDGSNNNTIEDNLIENSNENGIKIFATKKGCNNNKIIHNQIKAAENSGIEIYALNAVSNIYEIRGNTISDCFENGISLTEVSKAKLAGNDIKNNGGDGIRVSGGSDNLITWNRVFENVKSGLIVYSNKDCLVKGNSIWNNGEQGIFIDSNDDISIERNVITENGANGIYVQKCTFTSIGSNNIIRGHNKTENKNSGIYCSAIIDPIMVFGNTISDNCQGIGVYNAQAKNGIILRNNKITNSSCSFTGIHLEGGNNELIGNEISGNNGAAVALFNNATADIEGNNIYNNPDYAILNENTNNDVNVDNNFWGSTSEPDVGIFSGSINYTNWLDAPISLVISKGTDTLVTASGKTDSVSVAFQNFALSNDQIEVTLSDEKGWLLNDVTTQLNTVDSTFSSLPISFKIPSDAGSSFNNKVTISVVSLTDSEMTAVDSFYILNYTPELASIKVNPDSIALGLGDSIQFSVFATDQYEKEFSGTTNYNWMVSAGTIDSLGYFIADSISQVVTVTATEINSNITASANINIQPHTDIAETIVIYPDSIVVPLNGTVQFYAEGKDINGFDVNFSKDWLATGGTIDSIGYFTAGDVVGEYNVIVRDQLSGAEGVAKVIIGTPIVTSIERIIPKAYSLNQNYPNPFNPSTTISYALPYDSKVRVEIFNVLGQLVDVIANGMESAGLHSTLWEAGHLASGIYIIRINATSINSSANFTKSMKMILMK